MLNFIYKTGSLLPFFQLIFHCRKCLTLKSFWMIQLCGVSAATKAWRPAPRAQETLGLPRS